MLRPKDLATQAVADQGKVEALGKKMPREAKEELATKEK